MRRSRLFRQFLLICSIVTAFIIIADIVLLEQMSGPSPDLGRIRLLTILFSVSVVLIVVLAGGASVRLVLDSIRRVLKGMEQLRQGEYPLLVVQGDDELAELTRGFNRTVEELRSRDERLKKWAGQTESELRKLSRTLEEEQQKLETVLDSIGEGVIVLDSENKVLMANRRVSEIFGVPMEAINRAELKTLINQVRHRLVRPEAVQERIRQLEKEPSLVDEITLELDEPGGVAIRLYSAPLGGTDGKVLGRIATSLDLSKERELDRLKTEFLSTISHELRTPLTSVKGALGLIRGGAVGAVPADMRELLDIALTNTDRLIHVINDILDVFQLERGQARIRPVSMALFQSVERAVEAVSPQAELQKVTVETRISPELPAVKGDARRIEQVLVNLLSNAIKFSPPEQKVIVSACLDGEMVVVSVQDFGRGMSQEFLSRLFSKFEHAQGALTRESQGAGLGLAICRHVIDAHGGQIWAESDEGKGSTFYFSLPALHHREAAPPEAGQPEAARPAERRLILVIDDDEDVARVISYVLQSEGHRVICVDNGREAIELARKHRPDMLTLDLIMPEIDGYRVLETLRSSEETKTIPIICISVQPDPGPALSHGADYYLEKPLDIEKLRQTTARALAAR